MFSGPFALALAAFFAGAAVYISFIEQPARLLLDNRSLLIEWQHSYPAGMKMQGTLAIVAGLAGSGPHGPRAIGAGCSAPR